MAGEREVKLFSELEIWVHKHVIHIAVVLIVTGLAISASTLPSWIRWTVDWIPYLLGTPAAKAAALLGGSPIEQSYDAYSLGVQIARIIHRIAGVALIAFGIVWLIGELPRARQWQIWPEGGLGEAIKNLMNYYLGKKPARFGKYNIGQKLWIIAVVVGSALLAITGIIMWFRTSFSLETETLAHQLHVWLAWLGIAGLIVHVYLTIGIPEHRPAVRAMFRTGTVPEEFVKEHHPLYYEKLKKTATSGKK
ncbi:formate dehydrogenase subunit gamma [Hyperthermus butylicus]|uniref:Formate dehydrogenase, cytochrome b n=1 Tax=Hyperthermus butylicus (strain DSM 5456 / JCM 9403 / PLM1-5) TaxID=415426 RepID=A2BLN5_HYPBU|nr:cytochrome b/b6 domain-containing protein [Hyperthermus butylicus]ABM80896.1 Formate dehydrogenase, cytochrome b [Hyperthermus butylicus DSM 5456]